MNKKQKNIFNEALELYTNKRIVIGTLETQGDIQLKYTVNIPPLERLRLINTLNRYAFKNPPKESILKPKGRITFTSFSYPKSLKKGD